MTDPNPEPEPREPLKATYIHPACVCQWEPAEVGYVRTRWNQHCVIHRRPGFGNDPA